MSGTILDKEMFCYINGIEIQDAAYIEIDSNFPVENRPIFWVKGLGKMTYNEKVETFKNQSIFIDKILQKYPKDKGIIHTNSYELTNWIKNAINNNRLLFHETENREEIYTQFINEDKPRVLVSPSMTDGISLDDDKSRVGIIAKIPFPNLSSNKIKMRKKINDEWYSYITVATLIQSVGRIVRSDTDYGYNFILDDSFGDILRRSSRYIPNYFLEAIQIIQV
jgi:Rad3-related DNA helicase